MDSYPMRNIRINPENNVQSPYGNAGNAQMVSPLIDTARQYLYSTMKWSPQPYQSRYSEQISSLYDQIMRRPGFSYNAGRDPLFQQYRDQYIRNGLHAMQDSAGISAALTGGYGNSWASTAGYQAYAEYLNALNDKLPELEKRAQERYSMEEQSLNDRMNLLMNLDDREYGWYRDSMSDWQYNAKQALEQKKFNLEVQRYLDSLQNYR
ncbi:MAG: hypothetical protein IKH57_08440 [Clostridia bacterium]|nr:hypothetical protein [Clostridia bacterium]